MPDYQDAPAFLEFREILMVQRASLTYVKPFLILCRVANRDCNADHIQLQLSRYNNITRRGLIFNNFNVIRWERN